VCVYTYKELIDNRVIYIIMLEAER